MLRQAVGIGEAPPPRRVGVFQPISDRRKSAVCRGVRLESTDVGHFEFFGEVRRNRVDLLHRRRTSVEQRQAGLATDVFCLRRRVI